MGVPGLGRLAAVSEVAVSLLWLRRPRPGLPVEARLPAWQTSVSLVEHWELQRSQMGPVAPPMIARSSHCEMQSPSEKWDANLPGIEQSAAVLVPQFAARPQRRPIQPSRHLMAPPDQSLLWVIPLPPSPSRQVSVAHRWIARSSSALKPAHVLTKLSKQPGPHSVVPARSPSRPPTRNRGPLWNPPATVPRLEAGVQPSAPEMRRQPTRTSASCLSP
jgi:hypothetical protein